MLCHDSNSSGAILVKALTRRLELSLFSVVAKLCQLGVKQITTPADTTVGRLLVWGQLG